MAPIALVTGASSGIGKALVKELLASGYEVIGVARSKEKLATLRHPLLSTYVCDVSRKEDVHSLSQELIQLKKIPKLFFLNAGISGLVALEGVDGFDVEAHRRIFAVNYFGVLHFVEEWMKPCIQNGGATFVVSSSIVALFAPPKRSAYAASKAAISKAFDSLRITHRKNRLKFQSVFCCPVDTPGLSAELPFTWSPEKMAKYMVKKAEQGKAHAYPSWLFTSVCKLLNKLPDRLVAWLMKYEKVKSNNLV